MSRSLTLDRPALYRICVPGQLDESWAGWSGGLAVSVEQGGDGDPTTVLTGTLDQAALLSLLRRLYGLGLPLLSVVWVGEA